MRPRALLAVAAGLATTIVCSAGAAVESGAATGQSSRPLLGSDHTGTIYSVQPGGAGFTRLFPCGLGSPVLSPDRRTYLAHGIERRAVLTYGRIFRLPVTEPVDLGCVNGHNDRLPAADTGLKGWFPRFSPNGRRILFIDDKSGRVAAAAANGSGKRLIGPRDVVAAGWSPDGGKIVIARPSFHSPCPTSQGRPPSSNKYCYTGQIQVMDANGANVRTLYVVPKYKPQRQLIGVRTVDWSRLGKILFTIQSGAGASQLAVIDADGSGFRAVTKWPQRAINGVWSPTGRQIAFSTRGVGGVFLITPAGRPISNVTKTFATNGLDW
jgi:hypothetical protein